MAVGVCTPQTFWNSIANLKTSIPNDKILLAKMISLITHAYSLTGSSAFGPHNFTIHYFTFQSCDMCAAKKFHCSIGSYQLFLSPIYSPYSNARLIVWLSSLSINILLWFIFQRELVVICLMSEGDITCGIFLNKLVTYICHFDNIYACLIVR